MRLREQSRKVFITLFSLKSEREKVSREIHKPLFKKNMDSMGMAQMFRIQSKMRYISCNKKEKPIHFLSGHVWYARRYETGAPETKLILFWKLRCSQHCESNLEQQCIKYVRMYQLPTKLPHHCICTTNLNCYAPTRQVVLVRFHIQKRNVEWPVVWYGIGFRFSVRDQIKS